MGGIFRSFRIKIMFRKRCKYSCSENISKSCSKTKVHPLLRVLTKQKKRMPYVESLQKDSMRPTSA